MNQDLSKTEKAQAEAAAQPRDDRQAESPPPVEGQAAEQYGQLRKELEEANDRALRARAELDNFRKRTQRELESERLYAAMPLLRELLPVTDNIRRAIEAAQQSPDATSLLEGFQMVAQQIQNVLAQHGCQPIPVETGETFDPNVHEAVSQLPSDQVDAGQVIEVTQVGYQLHDRVIRPSQVVVSSGDPAAGER
ncbi:MAG: nucleotide exchange factor GrpE [Planctomycetales bacterium]|nr:nucleotide exchange factor GrpE [Planctomycetales bacterium]NIM10164.1 nucleotide exchange factor GrpE [Planctomycetales bacterium]NIN09590.1 nucleotide exchange factor GrpE [Planctomycetales bacterium]NIN78713.1 nucleotide exchange factor GrpE [Planctomycetales bacterium]NIO35890.1 nucleotide exchange factor GrpE [Planctomycetales bacterium]